jgi:hypothetical protein
MITVIPELSVPIPEGRDAVMELHAKADALFNTAEFLEAFGVSTEPTEVDKVAARSAFHASATSAPPGMPAPGLTTAITTSASAKYLRSILSEYDQVVVQSAVQIRTYVTNKLIEETTNPDAKIRIRALELLGKVGDVGLFVERSEVTVKHKTTIELEASIKDRVAKLLELKSKREMAEDVTPKEPDPRGAAQKLLDEEPVDNGN